ncbi:MAG TPA: 30S ribosomal protein S12 methylthiotransferase RimO [Gemmatimonadaceae bacterium]|nr:30S ribosomal protein S12 methylthiotransferase RimO [Gemmatimonadaceae bacterium]
MRFHVVTLGCDKNTVDSERYVAELTALGAQSTPDADEADLIVVNTCGFIDAAKEESLEAIIEATRFKSSGNCRMIAAVGCMVERHAGELRDSLPEVDVFLGTRETDRLISEVSSRGLFDDAPALVHPGVRLYTGDLPHVRYLKISEGCDHGCAFCAIPLMRGRHRSFAMDEVVREAQLLELQGAREINLVAQDLAHYGRDVRDGRGLPDLLSTLVAETGIPWFRLLYIYSAGLTPRMLDLMAREPRILRYLDIPMQHASDAVLERMRRPERQARQREKLRLIREAVPNVAIRSTVIVGFPGETEEDVQQLLDFLAEVRLDRVGVFTYSAQEGTRAFDLPDDVPDDVKRERLERVNEVQRLVTTEGYESELGRTVSAIVDRITADGRVQARTDGQADEIDGVTWLNRTAGIGPGDIVEVTLVAVVNDVDFEATLVRRLSERVAHVVTKPRVLPVMSTAGAFGR